ncbi:MAG: putative selenium-dependent hydroxylase accessory protein YqeC [Clostridia bacterium]|nr:putative selenium-dependent hydroxylase accessory protein YqeC [Clostridia bacterium]
MYRPFDEFRAAGKLISVIGSGGKTAFLRYWSGRLPGTVLLTTSTHILPFADLPLAETDPAGREPTLRKLRSLLLRNRVVCLGRPGPDGKLSDPSGTVPFEALLSEADHILVEADGSARRPLKAHRSTEPVIPAVSSVTVGIIGASGIGKPVSEVCHCPELFSSLAGITPDEAVRPEHIAAVINRENLADCYLVNQADAADPGDVRLLCDLISRDAFPCSLLPR